MRFLIALVISVCLAGTSFGKQIEDRAGKCTNGKICTGDEKCCPSGPLGAGGCFLSPKSCCGGAFCSIGESCCPGAGCINASRGESCCNNKVCVGKPNCCSPGSRGPGGCYDSKVQRCCKTGLIIPLGKAC